MSSCHWNLSLNIDLFLCKFTWFKTQSNLRRYAVKSLPFLPPSTLSLNVTPPIICFIFLVGSFQSFTNKNKYTMLFPPFSPPFLNNNSKKGSKLYGFFPANWIKSLLMDVQCSVSALIYITNCLLLIWFFPDFWYYIQHCKSHSCTYLFI